jgi:hypothetical protein
MLLQRLKRGDSIGQNFHLVKFAKYGPDPAVLDLDRDQELDLFLGRIRLRNKWFRMHNTAAYGTC